MMKIPGYTLTASLCEADGLALYQATRMHDGQPVLIKVPAAPRPAPVLLRRLEHEYELARDLDPGLIALPFALERFAGSAALIMKPGPARSLASLLGLPMEIQTFLRIAIGITGALAELHRQELIHKDIKPEHVLLDEEDHVWLTGLGIASRLPREHQAPKPPEVIDGTLAYMAPEQTGRMNRSIDSRSDLYAMGVTFYQMLTGVLPFTAGDAMEWVHCHIARQPLPPGRQVAGVPEPLSAMVMKLLFKAAEDRYQSAAGLDADLRRCLAQWESTGCIGPFKLGGHDAPDRLLIPEKLYGRKAEIDTLLAAFNRVVASGTPELVLVSGYSGIGKTSVVHELHKALVPPRGLFASGKFDQFKRDIPYATLVQALQTLIRQIISKGDAEVAAWRDAIQKAVSPNGQLIVGLIPEVELIIGKQPPVQELPPQEAQNRFRMVLLRFLGMFAGPEHPLALFLDDLQWLDTATLELIEQLATGHEVSHLLLIGAYRDNEVDPAHPLVRIIEAIRKAGTGLWEIVLAPLVIDDVGSLVADSLHCNRERALPLARLVHEKTGGNPFFAIQFLTALAEEKLLAIDAGTGSCTWDLARIHAKGYSDNVVDLMVGKLCRLPATTLETLEQFACLGNVADIATLTAVCGQSEDALHAALWEAMYAGLVFRQEKSYVFLHDRVQEAAYAFISEARRKELHLMIGRLLLARYPQEALVERVFEVADQLNRSVEIIRDAGEIEALRRLNTAAGRKARAAVAYTSARRYFEQAVALLPADCWNELYAESMSLFTELAECDYLLGNFRNSDELLTLALEKARSTLDQVMVYRLRQRLYQYSGRWQEAASAALEGLELLGVSFPESDEDIRLATEAEKYRIQVNLHGRRIADLADAPFTDDANAQVLIGLLAESITQFFITRPVLWHLIVLKCVNLCLERGHVEEAPYIYSSYCKMLVALYNDIPSAFKLSQMSLKLNERLKGGFMKGLPPFFHASVVSNWCQHFATNLPLFDQAFQAFVDAGNVIWANYLTYNAVWLHLENGDQLEQVIKLARRYAAFNQQSHNDIVYIVVRVEEQFALSLQGKTRSLTDFNNEAFDEAASVAAIEHACFGIGICYYRITKQIAAFIAGQYDEALEWADRVVPVLASVSSMAIWGTYYFYHALCVAALYERTGEEQRQEFMSRLADILKRLKSWADNCPENFANRHFLVSAEIARIEGRDMEAMRLYDQSILSARDNNFVHQEAVAAEIASRFYRARGFDRFAGVYLRDARACYARWGALGKVRQLEQGYPQLREAEPLAPSNTLSIGAGEIDLLAVVQASQAISGELSLDNVLKTLMRIVLENAGAQEGYLLLIREEELRLAAVARVEERNIVTQLRSDPMFPEPMLPASILNYVHRSRDKVLLEDATSPNPYSADEYFSHRRPKSVLCFPVTRQTKLIGALYLENELATHAFTPDRLAVLELLAAQAAISLETADAHEALRLNELRNRLGQTAAHIGTWEYDLKSKHFWGSDEAKHIYGFPLERPKFPEDEVEACIPERQRVHQALLDLIGKSAPYDLEFEIRPADGSEARMISSIAELYRDDQGTPLKVVGVIQDITGRKMAEEDLRRMNERFFLATQAGQVGVWDWDIPKNELVWDNSMYRLYGIQKQDFGGAYDAWARTIHPQDKAHTEGEIQAALRGEREYAPEFRIVRPDGVIRHLKADSRTFRDKDDKPLRMIGTNIDITERKLAEETLHLQTVELEEEVVERQMAQENLQEKALQLEEEIEKRQKAQVELEKLNESLEQRVKERTAELVENQLALMNIVGDLNLKTVELEDANSRLQELDRLKSMFIASMSHELRTPLNSVIGFSRILLDEWIGPLNGEQKENLATVLRSGKHLLSLINDVIDVSKIEAGMIEACAEDFDICDVISEAVKFFENDVKNKGVDLKAQPIHHSMHTDRTRLLQCLLNLVSNAVKYTEKGAITICAEVPDGSGMLELSVADTGIGIKEGDFDKLFSPFVRLDSHLKSTVPGTGLGLYLTRKLAKEVLQGEITVTSITGIGSRFVLAVPIS